MNTCFHLRQEVDGEIIVSHCPLVLILPTNITGLSAEQPWLQQPKVDCSGHFSRNLCSSLQLLQIIKIGALRMLFSGWMKV